MMVVIMIISNGHIHDYVGYCSVMVIIMVIMMVNDVHLKLSWVHSACEKVHDDSLMING